MIVPSVRHPGNVRAFAQCRPTLVCYPVGRNRSCCPQWACAFAIYTGANIRRPLWSGKNKSKCSGASRRPSRPVPFLNFSLSRKCLKTSKRAPCDLFAVARSEANSGRTWPKFQDFISGSLKFRRKISNMLEMWIMRWSIIIKNARRD